jgi:molecular chaperone DnaK
MKRDAEAHAAEDKARRELVDLKNRADAFVIQTRKALEEHGGKVTAETRGAVESALSGLETKIKGDDKAAIEAGMKELEKASMELGKIVYEQAAKEQASSTAEPKPAGGGNAKDQHHGHNKD